MKIYLDLLFIQDFLMNSLIIFLTSKLLNKKIKIVRILTISSLLSLFSIILLVFLPALHDNIFIKMIISFLIIKYGFKIKIDDKILPKIITFWLITILFGGIGIFANRNIFKMIILLIIATVFTIKFNSNKKEQLLLEAATCLIEFEYDKNKYSLKALVDTGNNVKTIYDEDVIFVKDTLVNIKGGDNKLKRIVSYQTISGTHRKEGIKIHNINISYGNRKMYNNAVIVSTPNISNCFDAIVSLTFIEGGYTDGNIDFNEAKSQKIIS